VQFIKGAVPEGRLIGVTLILALAVLVVVGNWQTGTRHAVQPAAVVHRPQGVMGTVCTLAAVVPQRDVAAARLALVQAECCLRGVEARMSNWLDDSEVSRLNAAAANAVVPLSAETRHVVDVARTAFADTGGTFDITCRPQIELWHTAGEIGLVPNASQRNACRSESNWKQIRTAEHGLVKLVDTVCIDLGGIAKGYAIDRAVDHLRTAGVHGAMVELGGDLACFGRQADGEPWRVDVRHPQHPDNLARIRVIDAAVATSGNYARYTEIAGRRYSHILDPRNCFPADAAESVTIVAPSAMIADIWATAISVLGTEGLERLPDRVDALLVIGSEQGTSVVCTPGFMRYFDGPLPEGLQCREAEKAASPR
jgi:thiamine biosynthesis lipoprotein